MVSWESSRTNRTSILPSRLEVRGFVWRRCYLGVLKADTSYILSLHHQKSLLSNITVTSMKNTVTSPVAVNCGHRDQLVKSILQIDLPIIMDLERVYNRGGSTGGAGGATAPPTKVLGGHCPSNKPWQLNLSMGGYVQLTK